MSVPIRPGAGTRYTISSFRNAESISPGRVDWDRTIFYKNFRTVPIAVWGRIYTIMGIGPGSVRELECGDGGIVRVREGFQKSQNFKKTKYSFRPRRK